MRTALRLWLLALGALAGVASCARADVDIRVPFVAVHVGGGVFVRAPFVRVMAPPPPVVVVPAPGPTVPPPDGVLPPPRRLGDPIPVPLPRPGQTDFSVPVPLPTPPPARLLTHR